MLKDYAQNIFVLKKNIFQEVRTMATCQRIMCSVGSCIYNTPKDNLCTLDSVQVSATAKSDSGAPYDETLCASYKTHHKKK